MIKNRGKNIRENRTWMQQSNLPIYYSSFERKNCTYGLISWYYRNIENSVQSNGGAVEMKLLSIPVGVSDFVEIRRNVCILQRIIYGACCI